MVNLLQEERINTHQTWEAEEHTLYLSSYAKKICIYMYTYSIHMECLNSFYRTSWDYSIYVGTANQGPCLHYRIPAVMSNAAI